MIKYEEFITPEEYMELRKMVGWVEFPIGSQWGRESMGTGVNGDGSH